MDKMVREAHHEGITSKWTEGGNGTSRGRGRCGRLAEEQSGQRAEARGGNALGNCQEASGAEGVPKEEQGPRD